MRTPLETKGMAMPSITGSVRFLLLLAVACATMAGQQWVNLFDGKTLNGWLNRRPDLATFVVEDGTIVAQPLLGSPKTSDYDVNFTTTQEFGDFVLEFEVKMDPGGDSGVQFRSQIAGTNTRIMQSPMAREGKPQSPATLTMLPPGDVYGYQFVLESANSGKWNGPGNVFDESRRKKYLDESMKERPGALSAFKDGEWNKCRIECRGDSIKTFINGIACADFRDSMEKRGVIALQIEGGRSAQVNQKTGKPVQVRWRNIRIQEFR